LDILFKNTDFSYDIIRANHGKEAVNICKNNDKIVLVLMDLKMPIMDGFEASQLIKKIRPNLTIIAQTAYTTGKEKKDAMLAGCDDFISKPINEQTFENMINKYLLF